MAAVVRYQPIFEHFFGKTFAIAWVYFLEFLAGLKLSFSNNKQSYDKLTIFCPYTPACKVNVLTGWKTQDVFLRGEAEAETPGVVTYLKDGVKK